MALFCFSLFSDGMLFAQACSYTWILQPSPPTQLRVQMSTTITGLFYEVGSHQLLPELASNHDSPMSASHIANITVFTTAPGQDMTEFLRQLG
jgi:hypothetical protein